MTVSNQVSSLASREFTFLLFDILSLLNVSNQVSSLASREKSSLPKRAGRITEFPIK